MIEMFTDKVIKIWTLMYNYDVNQSYTFTNFEKAIQSVSSSARTYLDQRIPEDIYDQIVDSVRKSSDLRYIPMKFGELEAVLFTTEIDKSNPLYKLLIDCYNNLDDVELKNRISELFTDA